MNPEFVHVVERIIYGVATLPLTALFIARHNAIDLGAGEVAGYVSNMLFYASRVEGKRKINLFDEFLTPMRVAAASSTHSAVIAWFLYMLTRTTQPYHISILTPALKVAADLLLMWGKPVMLSLVL